MRRYHGRGLNTVASVVETYAPRERKGGDNTDEQVNNYIKYVSGKLGLQPWQPISSNMIGALASAMRNFETGRR